MSFDGAGFGSRPESSTFSVGPQTSPDKGHPTPSDSDPGLRALSRGGGLQRAEAIAKAPKRYIKEWCLNGFSPDPRSSTKPDHSHRKSIVEGGPATGTCRENVESRFRKIFLYVCVCFWALNCTEGVAMASVWDIHAATARLGLFPPARSAGAYPVASVS